MSGPLEGIKIVDLTSVVFGPYATRTLGEMGADIIKVESPDGDTLRGVEPARSPGMGANFLNVNRNKRSLSLDLKKSEARQALLAVVAGADVFVHSLRPKAIEKLGLTYADLRPANEQLVYCNAWGFGKGGPYADVPAYDDIIQAMAGIADLNAMTGGEPTYAPQIVADKTSSLMLVSAITAALLHRERQGEGQEVEVPMFETMVSYSLVEHLNGEAFVPPESPMGYDRVLSPYRRPYATADGHIAVLPYTTKQWRAFFAAASRPEMFDDPRIVDPSERSRSIDDLYEMVAEIMPARTTAEWMALFGKADIPAMPVTRLEDLQSDPQLKQQEFFIDYDHPTQGQLRATKPPIRFSKSPAETLRCHPPGLGEHSREVLSEAGVPDAEIEALIGAGAVVLAPGR